MKLYVDTRPDEPMDANTAERFREVEVPKKRTSTYASASDVALGYNDCIDDLTDNIQSAIGAGEGRGQ